MKNIFENAKFSDKFQARDGAMAIFVELVHSDNFNTDFAKLLDNVTLKIQHYNLDGTKINIENKCDCDIISKWKEEIDEKALQTLEIKYFTKDVENGVMENDLKRWYPNDEQSWVQGYNIGFDRGYKAAKKGE